MSPRTACTAEVGTPVGLVTYSVLCFSPRGRRQAYVAGGTLHPDEGGMTHIARQGTLVDGGCLQPGHSRLHDGDGKDCAALQHASAAAGVTRVPFPPRSPNVNAYAERWRSIKEEALSQLILFGERALWHALTAYVRHFHAERPHQGTGKVVLMPSLHHHAEWQGPIRCRERLGGLLKYYSQEAA